MRNLLFVPVKRLLGLFIGLLIIVGVGFKGQHIASFLYTDLHLKVVFPPEMILFTIYFLSLAGILLITLYTERDKVDPEFKSIVKPYASYGNLASMIAFGILFYFYYNSFTALIYYYFLSFASLITNGIIAYFMEVKIKEYDESLNGEGGYDDSQFNSQTDLNDGHETSIFGESSEFGDEDEDGKDLKLPEIEIGDNFSNVWVGSYIYPTEDFLRSNFKEMKT